MNDSGKTKRLALCLSALLLASTAACTGNDDDDDIQYPDAPPATVGGDRPALVYAPSDYDPTRAYPLVILLHGYSANATLQDFIFGLKNRVDSLDFLLVTPEGTVDEGGDQFWNATEECCDFGGVGVDDVAYISGLIEESSQTMHVDPDRVALVGHSNGGYMSYRMACERPDLFDRMAVLAGSVYIDPDDCANPAPVSLLHIHGTDDETILYEPGSIGGNGRFLTVGAEESVGRWLDRNGCPATAESSSNADFHPGLEGEETEISRWGGCQSGKAVEFWKIAGGDHLLVGVNDDFRDRVSTFLTQ